MDARSALTKFNVLTANPKDNENGLVGWWTFDDGTATDWSGNQNNGTLVNGPISSPGIVGNSLLCNGTNQYINIPYNLSFRSNALTISIWVKRVGTIGNAHYSIFGKGLSVIQDWTLEIPTTGGGLTTNQIAFVWYAASQWNGIQSSSLATTLLPVGIWTKIDVTRSASGSPSAALMYINGQLVSTSTIGTNSPTNTNSVNPTIGGEPTTPAYFNAYFDDARIYNRALSAAEINAIYNQGLSYQQGSPEMEMPALSLLAITTALIARAASIAKANAQAAGALVIAGIVKSANVSHQSSFSGTTSLVSRGASAAMSRTSYALSAGLKSLALLISKSTGLSIGAVSIAATSRSMSKTRTASGYSLALASKALIISKTKAFANGSLFLHAAGYAQTTARSIVTSAAALISISGIISAAIKAWNSITAAPRKTITTKPNYIIQVSRNRKDGR
jgi:hypothetical protein